MPPRINLDKMRDHDPSNGERRINITLPWQLFRTIGIRAKAEGRSFSAQAARMLQEATDEWRRNGGKAR
jgi:hypothetical protein